MESLTITSPVFRQNQTIPWKYTCDGSNVNPSLIIGNVPAETRSLALIIEDPDAPAGIWVHWLLWNIGPDTREIRENAVPPGAVQGINGFKKYGYGGPCPPSGTHRYFFRIYALDKMLDLPDKAEKNTLERAMKGHVLAQAELIGLYGKK